MNECLRNEVTRTASSALLKSHPSCRCHSNEPGRLLSGPGCSCGLMAPVPLKLLVLPWFFLAGDARGQTQPSPSEGAPSLAGVDPPVVRLREAGVVPTDRLRPLVASWFESVWGRHFWFWGFSNACSCDLTPNSCDLNCCCDDECYLKESRMIFKDCLPGSYRILGWKCVDPSIMFQSNTPFHVETLMIPDSGPNFCIQVKNPILNYFHHLQKVNETNIQSLIKNYGGKSFFSEPPPTPIYSSFYKAGDPIVIYFPSQSLLSLLKHPTEIGPSGLCTDNNAAKFLENGHTTCTRFFSNLTSSCTTDPSLTVTSYHNFMVLKVPKGVIDLKNMQVPITLTSEPILPQLDGNTCYNVVSQVIYEIETNGTLGIQKISLSFILMNLSGDPGAAFQQHFTIRFHTFQRRRPAVPLVRSGNPGYIFGMPLLVLKGDTSDPMTVLQSHSDGSCSMNRRKVEFGVNMMTGCKFRIENRSCDHLQDEIYKTLSAISNPVYIGIMGNSEPSHRGHWIKAFTQNSSALAKNCTSCCCLPSSLEIQILWAYVGLQANAQAHVFGGQYLYQCNFITLPSSVEEIFLTTFVSFTDITKKPEFTKSQKERKWTSIFSSPHFLGALNGEKESLRSLSTSAVLLCVLFFLSLEMS
ncbi:tectonic-3 [Antechinus flavipes]|uniref:tectonic-3 n=1 Tax=Antechinus flavipes TaxID=38775 RepID=UPI00223546BF|nr:tectonic-3 [Antechinus flavipes]